MSTLEDAAMAAVELLESAKDDYRLFPSEKNFAEQRRQRPPRRAIVLAAADIGRGMP